MSIPALTTLHIHANLGANDAQLIRHLRNEEVLSGPVARSVRVAAASAGGLRDKFKGPTFPCTARERC